MKKRKSPWRKVAQLLLGKNATQNPGDGSGGQFALVTPCRGVDFSLWATKEAAEQYNARLRGGCCGGCWHERHYILDLAEVHASDK